MEDQIKSANRALQRGVRTTNTLDATLNTAIFLVKFCLSSHPSEFKDAISDLDPIITCTKRQTRKLGVVLETVGISTLLEAYLNLDE